MKSLRMRFGDALRRASKYTRVSLRRRPAPARAVFVVGCQRSGTNMLMSVLDRTDDIWTYDEALRNAAFEGFRLRPFPVITRLSQRALAPIVAYKPVCDSQIIDRLLNDHPGSRAIWIYRDYRDVAQSAVRLWGDHQLNVVRRIAAGNLNEDGWRTERMAPDTVATIHNIVTPELSNVGAAAIKWYYRNKLFFDLGLENRSDVMLASYEDLVKAPGQSFARVFAFVGIPFEDRFSQGVFTSSVGRAANIELPKAIEEVCSTMLVRLDATYQTQTKERQDVV